MNIKSRILKLESNLKQQGTGECSCSGSMVVRPNGETSHLCPACIRYAAQHGWILIEPSLENIPVNTQGNV